MGLNSTSIIKVNLGLGPNGAVQKFFTNTCRKYMDKYVPKRDGTLREVVRMETDKITYQTPYAHAQYIGIIHGTPVNTDNYTTPRNRSILGQKNGIGRNKTSSSRNTGFH